MKFNTPKIMKENISLILGCTALIRYFDEEIKTCTRYASDLVYYSVYIELEIFFKYNLQPTDSKESRERGGREFEGIY